MTRSEMEAKRLHRHNDPHTSVEAAAKVDTFVAGHEAKCYEAICNAQGATYREIAEACGLEPVACARRLSSMEKRGLIRRLRDTVTGKHLTRFGMALWYKTW